MLTRLKSRTARIAAALILAVVSFAGVAVASSGVASASSWSCTVSKGYFNNARVTLADCWTNTPANTVGYAVAKQTCATSTSQYTQSGNVAVASYHNGWTGVSSTPSCSGYVVARWVETNYVPVFR